MGWCRLRRRWGGTLALITLALQLAASFGHSHGAPGDGSAGGFSLASADPGG